VIRRITRDCVPVALNVDKVSAAKGPDGDFFRAVQKQRPRQSQGIYLVSPDGKVLAGHDRAPKDPHDWPQALLDAIDEGLSKFGPVTPRPARRAAFLPYRGAGVRPDGGIVLAAYTRFLLLGLDRRGFGSVVYDSVPVTKDEAVELTPSDMARGATWPVPTSLVRRLHVVLSADSGRSTLARPEEVTVARLKGKVERINGGVAYLSFEGKIAGEHEGEYVPNKGKTMFAEMGLVGAGRCEVKTGKLLSLTLVGDGRVKGYPPYDQWRRYGAVVEWRRER
jgi:hypothetical protein